MSIKKYMWDKKFFNMVKLIAIPVILQQIIETIVGLMDSVMVSQYSEIGVGAVQIGLQWETIAFLFSFGICSGIGIYTAQFFGSKDFTNLKKAFGTKMILTVGCSVPFVLLAVLFAKPITGFYIDDPLVIAEGAKYLVISSISYIPVMISFAYNYTYRCLGKTKTSMYISSLSVISNTFFNYVLIFGKFGLPEMGVSGAALATLLARLLSMTIHIIYAKKTNQVFIGSFKEMFSFDKEFVSPIIKRATPTIVNEAMFGIGQTLYVKAYGMIGVAAITSISIADRISGLFFMAVWAVSSSVQAIIGTQLGKKDFETAKKYANYFIGLTTVCTIVLGIGIVVAAPLLVELLYGTQVEVVKDAAIYILMAYAVKLCLRFFNAVIFAFLRAGGDTKFLAFLDSGILYAVGIPLAFTMVYLFKDVSVVLVVLLVQIEQLVRIIIAFKRYKSGLWIKNLTSEVN